MNIKSKQQWAELLEYSRKNYLKAIGTLSNHQKQIEYVISIVIKKNKSITEEHIRKIKDWAKQNYEKRISFFSNWKDNLYESLLIIPDIENKEFKNRFFKMMNSFQECYNSFIGSLKK